MEAIWDRLKKACFMRYHCTPQQFAEKAGITESEFVKLIDEDARLTSEQRRKISKAFPKLNMLWVETGFGVPFIDSEGDDGLSNLNVSTYGIKEG